MSIPDLTKETCYWTDSIESLSVEAKKIMDMDNPLEPSVKDKKIEELIESLLKEKISGEIRLGTMPVVLGETENITADKVFNWVSKLPEEEKKLAERVFLVSFLTFYKSFESMLHLKAKKAPFKLDESKIRRELQSLKIITNKSLRIRLTKLYGHSLEFNLLSQEAMCLSKLVGEDGFNFVWNKKEYTENVKTINTIFQGYSRAFFINDIGDNVHEVNEYITNECMTLI